MHNNLGFAYARLDNFEKAEEHFKLAGPPAQASNNLGFVYEAQGDDEHAYEYYYLAVKQDPLLQPARANLARVCERLGRLVPQVEIPDVKTEPLPPPEAIISQATAVSTNSKAEEGQ